MGPNSINPLSTPGMTAVESTPQKSAGTTAATTTSGVMIKYGDSIKSDRLQAGLQALQAAQARTASYIRTINPDIGTL